MGFWKRLFGRDDPPQGPKDFRVWNENWRVGDTAECIVGLPGYDEYWGAETPPWLRLEPGQRLTVSGFSEGQDRSGNLRYFLKFSDWPCNLPTIAFRKVRTAKQSEVVERILKAKPGQDRVREPVGE